MGQLFLQQPAEGPSFTISWLGAVPSYPPFVDSGAGPQRYSGLRFA
jgi:hypothetical protein